VGNWWIKDKKIELKGRSGLDSGTFLEGEELDLSRLREKYEKEIVPAMMKEFQYKSIMAVPRMEKVVLNMGLGEAIYNIKVLDKGVEELTHIAGQKAVITKARKSIAGFKLREGMPIGCMVTLRAFRMYDFLDKLFNVTLPRVRDFRGVSEKIFDGRGNCTLGVKEQIVFPEIEYDKVDKAKGLNISIITTAKKDEEALFLLRLLGMPFRRG
jgi:large subunit ribosomal protein L5